MRKIGTFLLGATLAFSVKAQVTPLQNSGFETHNCSVNLLEVTCDYPTMTSAIYNGCIYPGWKNGSETPIYLHNNCASAYDASGGEFCVQLGHTGEGGNATIYYDFGSAVIQANKIYNLAFDYLTFEAEDDYYIYIMGSNTLTNNNGPLSTNTFNQLKVLGKHEVPMADADLVWSRVNMLLTNNTSNTYSQLLIFGSTNGSLDLVDDDVIYRDERDLDFVFAVDSFGNLIETGEYCCLIPLISFECYGSLPFRDVPTRPICATIEFLSPCNDVILDTDLFTYEFAAGENENPYCDTLASQEIVAEIAAQFPNACFEEEYFDFIIGNHALYSFTWPSQEFCYECNDLYVDFNFGSNIFNCYTPGTTTWAGQYMRYYFISTSSLGDETPVLYYWTFTLADGSTIHSTLFNPSFFLSLSRTQCNLGSVIWISSAITSATLTIYTENGCKRSATQSISPFQEENPEKVTELLNTRSTQNGIISLISNIVKDEIKLENQFEVPMEVNVNIISSNGVIKQLMKSGKLFPGSQQSFDVSDFPTGHYFLVLQNETYHEVYGFIKI